MSRWPGCPCPRPRPIGRRWPCRAACTECPTAGRHLEVAGARSRPARRTRTTPDTARPAGRIGPARWPTGHAGRSPQPLSPGLRTLPTSSGAARTVPH
ncbi:hypothetical protein ACFFX0_25485 [Citricoccus parietis]|uniref:Uncharacterized protein n=1 Tax=Citricoccus parietis TaxID=592307 RepID=A0ABV5G5Z2_9MICC